VKKLHTMWLFALIWLCFSANGFAIDWPVWPDSAIHYIGQGYGQYQYFPVPGDSNAFMHTGVDILVPENTPVYALKSGWVRSISTISGDMHWRVAIENTDGFPYRSYVYAHLEQSSMTDEAGLSVGDYIEEGQFLGRIVHYTWSGDTTIVFDHIHLSIVDAYDWSDPFSWQYLGNPLDSIDNIYDPDPPAFEEALPRRVFAFCQNQTADYYAPGETMCGEVDIICRVHDYMNHYDWPIPPYRMEYLIDGPTATDWIHGICFSTPLGPYNGPTQMATNVIYQKDSVCQSLGDFIDHVYYFNLTNNNGDSLIEAGDADYAWNTAEFLNGEYTVYVRASDRAGNSTIVSMGGVEIENYFTLSGNIDLMNLPNYKDGTIVRSLSTGACDTTDIYGDFSIPVISGGPHQIVICHPGYWPIDTTLMIDENTTLNAGLQSLTFNYGDASGNDVVDGGDILFLHDMLFNDGPAPDPYDAGNTNFCNGINIADLSFLVNYVYHGGTGPCDVIGLCDIPTGSNAVTLGCPMEVQSTGGDLLLEIPIYITNDFTIGGLTLGFEYNSYNAVVTSIEFYGSVVEGVFDTLGAQIWPDQNSILIYGYDLGQGLEPQADGYLATVYFMVPGGTEQIIDIDTSFIAPGSEFMFASTEGPAAYPAWYDCGTADIIISSAVTCGDANGDEATNIGDAVSVINYVFNAGLPPDPLCEGDCNADGDCNVGDAVYLINFVFNSGPDPVETCCR